MMSDRVVIAGIFLFGFAMENFFLMACAVICVTLGVVQSLIRMRNITRFYALNEDLKRISKQIQKVEKEAVGANRRRLGPRPQARTWTRFANSSRFSPKIQSSCSPDTSGERQAIVGSQIGTKRVGGRE